MGEFLFERLSDPEYYEENRVAAHSDHVAYRNWDEADVWLDPLGRKSSFRLFLDGSWKFHYARNYEQTIHGFEKPEYDCRGWDDIRVPAHIQMEGYDSPQYANTQYPWDGREDVWTDEMPTKFNPVASYVKYFTLPESFLGERVFISFQGAESGMALWLNGAYVGYSEDSFTPSEFELTPYLKDGENKLAVQVFKWTIGSWCEDQDFFRFSGIFRSVYLYMIPKTHLCDIKIRPQVAENLSCGNESYGGSVIYQMSEKFRELDPDRLVHYEGVYNDRRYNGSSDMESQMYPPVERIVKNLAEQKEKPFICCEYTHAMGNSCGAMHKYTDLTDTEPRYQGGFIWDYIDQSITKKDRYGKEFQAYGGDFLERPTEYNFSGNGICYAKGRAESPKMQEVKFNYQNISVSFTEDGFTVKNKNLFTDTAEYDCILLLEKNGVAAGRRKIALSVAPLSEKTFVLEELEGCMALADELEHAGKEAGAEYALTVSFVLRGELLWAKPGHEIAFGQKIFAAKSPANGGTIGDAAAEYEGKCVTNRKAGLQIIRGKWNLGVKGENFDVLFSYNSCGLVSYRYMGKELIEKIPMPNFWRAPIDNDCGSRMQGRMAQWKIASMYAGMSSKGMFDYEEPVVREEENSVSITYTYLLPTTPQAKCRVTYTVTPDAYVQTELTYDPVEELGDMPEFGILFKLNADYDRLEWYGLGPQETYADRRCGAKLGVYKNRVADNMAQYLVPQECGNKVGVRYAKVTDARGRGMLFTGDELSFSALPYTPHELENAMHAYELPEVHYTVVRVALAQMGIGGDDSWGAPVHPEYHIDVTKPLTLRFGFRGI